MHRELRCRALRQVAYVCAALIAAGAIGCARASDWLQFGGDAAHSGRNASERGYSTADGNRLVVGPVSLPVAVDGTPIFVETVSTAAGIKDLLLAVAKDGTLLALDAANGSVTWSARPVGNGTLTSAAPAIDPSRDRVYAYGLDGKVHKYNLGDGSEVVDAAWPQIATLKPDIEKSSSALTIAVAGNSHTYLYSATGSNVDLGDYQGHLTTIDLGAGTQNVFNAQCSELNMHFIANGVTSGPAQNDCTMIASPRPGQTAGSGLWSRAGAVFDAATDRVYFATGNGLFDPSNALGNGSDWGDSVLALNPDGTGAWSPGAPVDSYTPLTHAMQLQTDADLGSTSPAILPLPMSSTRRLAVQGGKDGCVRLLDLDVLSGVIGTGHVGGELQAINLPGTVNHCGDGGNLGAFKTQPATWRNADDDTVWIFIAYASGVVAYQLESDDDGGPELEQRWFHAAGGTSPVVANRAVYYAATGSLRALDATTGALLWQDGSIGGIHWQSPIVVNGRLYVFDEAARLWVYQMDGVFRGAFE
jgi:outer membrane protein assembly factor BamB